MTISSDNRKAGPFDGNDVAVAFPFAFTVFAISDLLVIHTDSAGVESTLIDGPDYSATMNPGQGTDPGGTVTLPVPLPAGEKLTITSALAYLQTLDLTNQGKFYPDVIETALDRITILSQQNAEQLSRSIKIGISDSTPADQYRDSLLQASRDAVNAAAGAATSESHAATSETNAATSTAAALASQNAAHASELAAALSEGNAAGSASAALASEGKAHGSEVAAGLSQAAALASQNAAHASELAAATSADNAATSEGSAHGAELAATQSASNAAISEANAQSYLNAMKDPFTLVKTYDGPAIIKSGAAGASIRAGTYVSVAGSYVTFLIDTAITLPGTMTPGEDYSVWVKPDSTAIAVADPFTSPASAPVAGALKIGGFHYSLTAPGTTPAAGGFNTASGVTSGGGSMLWTQAKVDRIAGINEFSIWDLAWRCKGEQRGMVFDPIAQCWVAIYFCGTDVDANGISRYNTDVASGTVLPKIPTAWGGDGTLKYAALRAWEAQELVSAHGLRLIRYEEFISAAFGVTEGQSLGGAAVTIPATARQPNFTSRIGLEQATGHVWVIGGPINSSNGSAYAGTGRGSWYGTTGLILLGGARNGAADSGSRAAVFSNALSNSNWSCSVRAAGDHLNLGRTAR
ncbi:MAG TPA: hypothetical protein VF285_03055 [Castellaniella sp.]|uniref:phage major tropism determinant n=1 Tax=Castellaniella sp. TaxID=1955812 RepID=UPI002F1C3E63